MKNRTILTIVATIGVTLGGAVAVAPSASAQGEPIVWHQSVARASADAPCPTTSDADKAAGWTDWAGSWDQWPNDGKGGYVCDRSITWAYEADASAGSSCVLVQTLPAYYDFGSSYFFAYGDPGTSYYDPACSEFRSSGLFNTNIVWAPGGSSQATARCQSAFSPTWVATRPDILLGPDVYVCAPQV